MTAHSVRSKIIPGWIVVVRENVSENKLVSIAAVFLDDTQRLPPLTTPPPPPPQDIPKKGCEGDYKQAGL